MADYSILDKSYWDDWRLLVRASKPQKKLLAIAFFTTLISAGLEGLGVGLIIPFVQNITGDGSGAGFVTHIDFVDRVFLAVGQDPITRLHRIAMTIALVALLRAGFGLISLYFGGKAQEFTAHELRKMVNAQSMDVALSFYSHARAGEIISISTNEAQRVRFLLDTIQAVSTRSFFLVMYAGAMIVISWQLSAFGLAVFLLVSLFMSVLTRWISQSAREVPKMLGTLTSITSETISGMRLIRALSMQEAEKKRYNDYSETTARQMVETHRRRAIVPTVNKSLSTILMLIMIVLAIQFFVMPGKLSGGELMAFLFALLRLEPIVAELNNARGTIATILPALSAIRDYVDRHDKPYLEDGHREMPSFSDQIQFENVCFEYDTGTPVLRDINLNVRQGMTVALVGGSGAGKSTLVDLIPRFLDVTSGSVRIDGVDIREFSQRSLRRHIGVVSQEAFVFNASVRDNIAYGLPDAPEEQIWDAARRANAVDFIKSFPRGMDTMLGDRGAAMSGGQRQRIEIARCFMRNPEILILDEATSALDSVSEKLFQESLNELMEGRTVFAIAHRLSTIRNADMVVVMENGRIVETGTYDELLERKGALYKYHSIQVDMELSNLPAS
ncbi:MAG: ABC transporter ATP-binding protein [Rhodothermales bacterium]